MKSGRAEYPAGYPFLPHYGQDLNQPHQKTLPFQFVQYQTVGQISVGAAENPLLAFGSLLVVNEMAVSIPERWSARSQRPAGTARLAAVWGSEPAMADSGELTLRVCPAPGDDAGELAETTGWLRAELLALDVREVGALPGEETPSGAKGISDVTGWLWVALGPEAVRAVLAKIADWVTRNDRAVEVSYGGDTLKLGRATHEQQERIIDDWLARHSAGS